MNRRLLAVLCGTALSLSVGIVSPLRAEPRSHVTDGTFTSGVEWIGPTVSQHFFPVVGQAGGAYLYVEQGFSQQVNPTFVGTPVALSPDTLFLMYDYVNSPALGFTAGDSFFDVFFEVPAGPDPADYLVRILPGPNTFNAFERPHGSPAPLNPDGSFNVGVGSGWAALDSEDLALARFHTGLSLGTSPNSSTPHLMAEFDLSIDNRAGGREGGSGLYDPAPAFWSASANDIGDPPISSAIFMLTSTGSTVVNPALGPNGGPVSRPQDLAGIPEPSSLLLLSSSGLLLAGTAFRPRRRA